jgi:hypothetical protein
MKSNGPLKTLQQVNEIGKNIRAMAGGRRLYIDASKLCEGERGRNVLGNPTLQHRLIATEAKLNAETEAMVARAEAIIEAGRN